MNIKERLRRQPGMGEGSQGRLLEEVMQDCFEVQDGTVEEKGLGKLSCGV